MNFVAAAGQSIRHFEDTNPFLVWVNEHLDGVEQHMVPDSWRQYLFGDGPDPRTAGFPLIRPALPLCLTVFYLTVVLGFPPLIRKFIGEKARLQLKMLSAVHNALLCVVSLYMAIETIAAASENFQWGEKDTFLGIFPFPFCHKVDGWDTGRRQWTPSGVCWDLRVLRDIAAKSSYNGVLCSVMNGPPGQGNGWRGC